MILAESLQNSALLSLKKHIFYTREKAQCIDTASLQKPFQHHTRHIVIAVRWVPGVRRKRKQPVLRSHNKQNQHGKQNRKHFGEWSLSVHSQQDCGFAAVHSIPRIPEMAKTFWRTRPKTVPRSLTIISCSNVAPFEPGHGHMPPDPPPVMFSSAAS